tara:strand:+ start:512 stop:814 length:303 start_codon:yes stop_codon:yes gene_type:complete
MKRKPRRKRLIDVTERSAEKLGYAKYRIEWLDISSDSGWANEKEFSRMRLATPVSEGWLFEKNRDVIKIFASYDKDEDALHFGERTVIPLSCVKKMTKIK